MAPNADLQKEASFPDLSYPSLRDEGLQTAEQWLLGKSMDDGAEGLWRIHDKLYDLTDFIKSHPGGEFWLTSSKGTDITEAFETHHISTLPESLLEQFFVRHAIGKRHSPFTFKPDGFYRTLKSRVRDELESLPPGSESLSKRIIELLTLSMFAFSIAACRTNWFWLKVALCLQAGVLMTWSINCAHNFTHKKDNWRMHIFNFSFIPSRDWRVTHILSHHLFPNTLLDMEVSTFEQFFKWLPREKTFFQRYAPRIYSIFVYSLVFDLTIVKAILNSIFTRSLSCFKLEDLVPFTLPLAMYTFGNATLKETLLIWVIIFHVASTLMLSIGINAGHHHPDLFHDGDAPCDDTDWGKHQLHTVLDRVDINGSHLRVLTNFGEHGLHHMFPTIDHVLLPHLRNVFVKTCQEFDTELKLTTQMQAIIGQFRQLARTERNMKKQF